MSVALGSLLGDDLRLLEDLHILPPDEDLSEQIVTESVPTTLVTGTTAVAPTAPSSSSRISYHSGTLAGVPWFEEMIEGSRLGRIMRNRRGIGVDDSTTFEWEISEWQDTDTGLQPTTVLTSVASASGKRKAEDILARAEPRKAEQ